LLEQNVATLEKALKEKEDETVILWWWFWSSPHYHPKTYFDFVFIGYPVVFGGFPF